MKDKDIEFLKTLIIKLDISIEAERNNVSADGLMLIFDFTEKNRKESITKALDILNKTQLKQQLEEKDKEINSLIVDYEKRISQEQELMSNMEHRLTEKQNTIDEINKEFVQVVHDWKTLCAEKDKEIEKLKQQYTILENENGKLTTELIMDKYKKAQKEVSFGKQLAIQELEKVKEWLEPKYFDYEQINYLTRIIDQQINYLRGEKDVED